MFRRLLLTAACSLTVLAAAGPAWAQGDMMQMARVMLANTMGVMTYCGDKGWGDQEILDMMRKSSAAMPAATDPAAVTSAEETGRKGSMLMNGQPMSLSSIASQSNTTEKDICTRMATAAKMAAAQAMQNGTMPGMPATPKP